MNTVSGFIPNEGAQVLFKKIINQPSRQQNQTK